MIYEHLTAKSAPGLAPGLTAAPLPANLRTNPWRHQIDAFHFAMQRLLSGGAALLALEMGVGKTLVALMALVALAAKRILICCPLRVVPVWEQQIKRHLDLPLIVVTLKVKVRVQHPKILEAKFREGWKWFFRYYADEVQANGSAKTVRKKHAVGFSRGDEKITKKQADVERDKFLAKQNAPTVEAAVEQVAATGVALFGEVAKMYEEGYLSRELQIAKPTRVKERFYWESTLCPNGAGCGSVRSGRRQLRTGCIRRSTRGGPCMECARL
jgi:hypothetical protein